MLIRKGIVALAVMASALWAILPAAAGQINTAAKWWRTPQIASQLHLSGNEIQRLDRLHLQMQQRITNQRNEINQAKLMIDNLMNRKPLNEKALQKQYARLGKAQTAIANEKSQFLVEVRKLLGRDRFQQLRQIFNRSRGRF